jgi:hypothetical protein
VCAEIKICPSMSILLIAANTQRSMFNPCSIEKRKSAQNLGAANIVFVFKSAYGGWHSPTSRDKMLRVIFRVSSGGGGGGGGGGAQGKLPPNSSTSHYCVVLDVLLFLN